MTEQQTQAMKLGLETLEALLWPSKDVENAITTLRAVLADNALDKMAENAREIGLDYEPVWDSGPTNKDYEDALRAKRVSQLTATLEQPAQQCWCTTCRPITMADMRFVVCPDCGNKRCPKANDHRNACTNSNAVGQKGSSWEHVKPVDEQPAQQEPVAYIRKDQLQKAAQSPMLCEIAPEPRQDRIGIYTRPQAREPLTDDELQAIADKCVLYPRDFARAIEAKLREKNHG